MKAFLFTILFALFSFLAIGQSKLNIGVELGQSAVSGDIEALYFEGYALRLYVQKPLFLFLNTESSIDLSRNYGLSHIPVSINSSSAEEVFAAYQNKNLAIVQNLSTTLRLDSFRFEIEPYLGIGLGTSKSFFNLLDENNMPYEDVAEESGYSNNDPDYLVKIDGIYDDTYETEGFIQRGLFGFGDLRFNLYYTAGLRLHYRLTDWLLLGLSHSYLFVKSDYLDGVKTRSEFETSRDRDFIQSTRLSLKLRFGT